MPYIKLEERTAYQDLLKEIFSNLEKSSFKESFAGFAATIFQNLYGSADATRYYLQNELCGVLACAALEWSRRTGVALNQAPPLAAKQNPCSSQLKEIAYLITAFISSRPETDRPGHLNYFLTLCMIEAAQRSFVTPEEVSLLLHTLLLQTYKTQTGPYEDRAISKNGEVFPKDLIGSGNA
jgi:hypothetical protein